MCGLFAILEKKGEPLSIRGAAHLYQAGEKMLSTLRRRGPDEVGLQALGSALLGHTRLSIIDLESGSQPIFNEDRSIAVLLNGEIYNYRILREALEKRGHRFQSRSDTEVIVHLYEECGEEVFSKLNGMFAIVLYDARANTLLAARDRAGEKPLVYWASEDFFVAASEIKALLQFPGVSREIDHQALALYLNSMYVPAPLTIFAQIRKLAPAHFLRVSGGKSSLHKYWSPGAEIRWDWQEDAIREEFLEVFADAVNIRTYADVPLGVFLSGGIDSSAVTAFMPRSPGVALRTYTVGFSQEVDERPYARIVASRYETQHTEILVEDRIEDVLEEVIGYFDEPFGDSSAVPTHLVSREARKYVKTILTGDGGDELFAGYGSYLDQKYQRGSRVATRLYKMLNQGFLGACGRGLLENAYPHATDGARALYHWHWVRTIFTDDELASLLRAKSLTCREFFGGNRWLEVPGADALSISYAFDMNFYLPDDLLKKVDMASMLCGLECRAPFLDYRLIELSLQIPPQLKVKNDCLKYLLKESLGQYLPPEILHRPKTGFGAPVDSWLRTHLRDMTRDHLAPGCRLESLLESAAIQRVCASFYSQSTQVDFRTGYKLWLLLVLELWMRKYLPGETS